MKIKIITCHNVYNHGASLQAFALMSYLKGLGHDVEIIDYLPCYLEHYYLWGHVSPAFDKQIIRTAYCLAKFPYRLYDLVGNKRKKAFDIFTRDYLLLTAQKYHTYEELSSNPPVADLYIAGSDQIWNSIFHNGKDPAFYLQFGSGQIKKASYAASFGANDIDRGYQKEITKWISELDFVSVRESTGIEILRSLGIFDGIQVLDPVFLLSRNEWEVLIRDYTITKEKYCLYYGFAGDDEAEASAVQIAHKNGLRIFSLSDSNVCDRSLKGVGPIEFLAYIKKAELVITSSFHATAFSLIFEKQMIVYRRKEAINTRIIDLLSEVGLNDCLMEPTNFRIIEIDYTKVKKMLELTIAISKEYLDLVLNS